MKISIQGNIINTKKIYQITPIVGDGCWIESNSWGPEKMLTHSGYMFSIEFLNKKEIKIHLRGNDVFEDELWWMRGSSEKFKMTKEEYETKLKIIYDELDIFRNSVISYWNKDKSEIPSIEFNIKKQ